MKMKLTLLLVAVIIAFTIACNNHKEEMKAAIKTALKTVTTSIDSGKLDNYAATHADSLMLAYVAKFPKDTLTPDLMLKTSQLYQMQRNYSEATKLLDKLVSDYPDSKAAPIGLYLNGFIFENNEGALDKAKTRYELFLKKYPNNDLAASVKTSLDNLGKAPEDIIKGFENKNQTDTAKIPS